MSNKKLIIILLLVLLLPAAAFALELPRDVDPGYQLNLTNAMESTITTFKTSLNLLFFLLVLSISSNVLMFVSLNKAQNQVKDALRTIQEINTFKDTVLEFLRKNVQDTSKLDSLMDLPQYEGEEIEILESQKIERA